MKRAVRRQSYEWFGVMNCGGRNVCFQQALCKACYDIIKCAVCC